MRIALFTEVFAPKIDGISARLARRARARAEKCDWRSETRGLVLQYRKAQVLSANRGFAGRLLRAVL